MSCIYIKKIFAQILLCSIEIFQNAIKEINVEILKLKDSLKLLIIIFDCLLIEVFFINYNDWK